MSYLLLLVHHRTVPHPTPLLPFLGRWHLLQVTLAVHQILRLVVASDV